jgi:hypothetical protein
VVGSDLTEASPARQRIFGLTAAIFVTCVSFFDVIFLGASFVASHYDAHLTATQRETVGSIPERANRQPAHGFIDVGASAWQMDPYRAFMASAFARGDTPYWNPLTAAGSVVPDNLTSQAFALPTVAAALMGGTDAAWHVCMLLLIWFSAWSVITICFDHLGLGRIAATGAAFAFLLNGFVTSSPAQLVVLPYYFAAPLILALFRFVDRPTAVRGAIASFALAAMMLATFIPTLLLCTLSAFAFAGFYGWQQNRERRHLAKILVGFGAIGAAAILMDAFLIVPTVDTVAHSDDLAVYKFARPFQQVDWRAAISLLSPKHFWESYIAYVLPAPLAPGRDHELNLYCHFGITVALTSTLVMSRRGLQVAPAAIGFVVVAAILMWRILALPGAATIISALPIVRFFNIQYWSSALTLCLTFCVGFGIQAALSGVRATVATLVIALLAFCNVIYLGFYFGAAVLPLNWAYVAIFVGVTGSIATLLIINRKTLAQPIGITLLIAIAAEGVFYTNHLKVRRYETLENQPSFVGWLKERTSPSGDRVFSTTMQALFPDTGAALGIPEIGTMSLGQSSFYSEFYNRFIVTEHKGALVWGFPSPVDATPRLMDALNLLGVRYVITGNDARRRPFASLPLVVTDGEISIFENPGRLGRLLFVNELIPGNGIPADFGASARLAAVTNDTELIRAARAEGVSAAGPSTGKGQIEAYSNGYVRVSCETAMPTVLILNDSWHRRWSARIDGRPVHLGRVNMTFRAVVLPAGRHIVEFSYASPLVTWAQIVSAVTILLAVLVLAICAFTNPRQSTRRGPAPEH